MKDDVVMRLLREVKAGKVSVEDARVALELSLIHISEPTRRRLISYAVF